MNTRSGSRLGVVLSSIVALAAFACSSPPPSSDLGTGTGSQKKTGSKTPSGSTDGTDDTGNGDKTAADMTTPPPAQQGGDTGLAATCAKKTTSQDCGTCCLDKTPNALDAADKVFGDCMCAPAACATQCAASVCSMTQNQNQPTAECSTCLQTNEMACGAKADATCNADPTCKAAEACYETACAPIEAKENGMK
jgi:hypothetical protein